MIAASVPTAPNIEDANVDPVTALLSSASSTVASLVGSENATNSTIDEFNNDPCYWSQPPYTEIRFVVVTLAGSVISLLSMVENAFFFYLFSTRRHHRTSFNAYMMYIAFFDFFVSGAYIMLMSVNIAADFFVSVHLMRFWYSYMIPMLTISHCAITSASFLILVATIERFLITVNSRYTRGMQRHRNWVILGAVVLAVLSKVSICREFKIESVEECNGLMSETSIALADFVHNTPYHWVFRYWYRNIVTTFFPFFALIGLNAKIITVLAKYEKENYEFCLTKASAKQMKRKKITRAATRTTVLVCLTYLISNSINVSLVSWETFFPESVHQYMLIYACAIDLGSLGAVIASAFRPLVYLICQEALRAEVKETLKVIFSPAGTVTRTKALTEQDILSSVEDTAPMHANHLLTVASLAMANKKHLSRRCSSIVELNFGEVSSDGTTGSGSDGQVLDTPPTSTPTTPVQSNGTIGTTFGASVREKMFPKNSAPSGSRKMSSSIFTLPIFRSTRAILFPRSSKNDDQRRQKGSNGCNHKQQQSTGARSRTPKSFQKPIGKQHSKSDWNQSNGRINNSKAPHQWNNSSPSTPLMEALKRHTAATSPLATNGQHKPTNYNHTKQLPRNQKQYSSTNANGIGNNIDHPISGEALEAIARRTSERKLRRQVRIAFMASKTPGCDSPRILVTGVSGEDEGPPEELN